LAQFGRNYFLRNIWKIDTDFGAECDDRFAWTNGDVGICHPLDDRYDLFVRDALSLNGIYIHRYLILGLRRKTLPEP